MAKIIFIGRLGRDVESKTSQNGKQYGVFSLCEDLGKDKNQWFSCMCGDKQAETLTKYTEKGCRVQVFGEITFTEKDGKTYNNVSVSDFKIIDFKKSNEQAQSQLPQQQYRQPQADTMPTAQMPEDDLPF